MGGGLRRGHRTRPPEPPTGPPCTHTGRRLSWRAGVSCLSAGLEGARPPATRAHAPRSARARGAPWSGRRAGRWYPTSRDRSTATGRGPGLAWICRRTGGGGPYRRMAIPAPLIHAQESRAAADGIAAHELSHRGGLAVRGRLSLGHRGGPSRGSAHPAMEPMGWHRPGPGGGPTSKQPRHARSVARGACGTRLRRQAPAVPCHG